MDYPELMAEITAKCTPELIASRDTQAIADVLSVGRVRVVSRLGGIGMIMGTLGPDAGAALLDGLSAASAGNSALKWGFTLINAGELDFGDPVTRGMIDSLVTAGLIPQSDSDALKEKAEVPDPVSELDVRIAIGGK